MYEKILKLNSHKNSFTILNNRILFNQCFLSKLYDLITIFIILLEKLKYTINKHIIRAFLKPIKINKKNFITLNFLEAFKT